MKKILLFVAIPIILLLALIFVFAQISKSFSSPMGSNPITNNAVPTPGSCKILEEKYCAQGKLAEKNSNGKTYSYVGFNLPEGTTLFAPYAGQLLKDKEDGKEFNGILGVLKTKDFKSGSIYIGDISFNNMSNEDILTSNVIGYIASNGIKNLGQYNFIYTINNSGNNGPVTDIKTLKSMFKQL